MDDAAFGPLDAAAVNRNAVADGAGPVRRDGNADGRKERCCSISRYERTNEDHAAGNE